MSDQSSLKPLAIALGAVFAGSLAGTASAAGNPFAQTELASGYMVAEKATTEGKCGEGMCGAMNKAQKTDKAPMEGKCGAQNKAQQEGKCGEGKCGAMGKAQKEGDTAATPEMPDNAVKPE